MKYLRLAPDPVHAYVLVFDPGDEVAREITSFARTVGIGAARLTGIGGFSQATLGYFDRNQRRYEPIAVDEQVELLSLLGDLALKDGEPLLHAHAVVARRGGSTIGGHLIAATVWPTLELFIDAYPTQLIKKDRSELGIATIELDT